MDGPDIRVRVEGELREIAGVIAPDLSWSDRDARLGLHNLD